MTLSSEKSGLTTYQLSSSDEAVTYAFEQKGLVSFPYQLLEVPAPEPNQTSGLPFHSNDHKSLINDIMNSNGSWTFGQKVGVAMAGTVATVAGLAYLIYRNWNGYF